MPDLERFTLQTRNKMGVISEDHLTTLVAVKREIAEMQRVVPNFLRGGNDILVQDTENDIEYHVDRAWKLVEM